MRPIYEADEPDRPASYLAGTTEGGHRSPELGGASLALIIVQGFHRILTVLGVQKQFDDRDPNEEGAESDIQPDQFDEPDNQ